MTSLLAKAYKAYLHSLFQEIHATKVEIGALVIEPIVIGAGGMKFVDPLFQKLLVLECKSRKIPVIFDEIFVGIYRLGHVSTYELLGVHPDIACYGKILTGGTVPLAVTLASDSVYNTFLSDSKAAALLHGHSYTAHPIGCAAALATLEEIKDIPAYEVCSILFNNYYLY